jgi:Fic family protein
VIFPTPQLTPIDFTVLERIGEIRDAFKYSISTPMRWYGLLRRNTFARAIQGSNSIEGYNVTAEEANAIADGETPLEAETEAQLNVANYRNAMTYVLQLSKSPRFSYDEGFIRSLHFMMLAHDLTKNPGNWRPSPIYVRDEAKQETVYEGPPVERVPRLIDELTNSLNYSSSEHVIVKAAMAHLNLVMIHPFSDGNGRMARCLQTLVLARDGVLEPTFCSIEEYLGRNTQDYYAVLAEVGHGSWNPQNDAYPWIKFNITAHYRQASTLVRRTRMLHRLWDELEIELRKRKLPERAIFALADAALGLRIRNPIYRAQADISENLATRDLKALVDQGLLLSQGEKRGRVYIASDVIKELRNKVYEPRVSEDPYVKPKDDNLALPFDPR